MFEEGTVFKERDEVRRLAMVRTTTLAEQALVARMASVRELIETDPSSIWRLDLEAQLGRSKSQKLWIFLEDPSSSRYAYYFSILYTLFVSSSVVLVIIQSMPSLSQHERRLQLADSIYVMVFTVEVIILGIFPFYLSFIIGEQDHGSFLAPIELTRPCLRLLKAARNFSGVGLLVRALTDAKEALYVPMYMLITVCVFGGSLSYFFERDQARHYDPETPNIQSAVSGIYFSVVTICSVGYGKMVPQTLPGIITSTLMIFMGMVYLSMPFAAIGASFSEVWYNKHLITIIERARQRLANWGFSANDVPMIFASFDLNSDGVVTYSELRKVVQVMGIRIEEDSLKNLFLFFDPEAVGHFDYRQFIRGLHESKQFRGMNLLTRQKNFIDDARGTGEYSLQIAPCNSMLSLLIPRTLDDAWQDGIPLCPFSPLFCISIEYQDVDTVFGWNDSRIG
ncbi:hypothetical protein FOL47_010735 [Perkinsus chesapeaki]|uniref:EF-hand domain-containing protein n=1 Tax=Perkinsus chesapeaki TaxID=330153 RepID=A0A7J6MP58_PERCH|nr:hypothetical protein FOL47_010735 [Perkinsus chesapeaki]